MSFQVTDRVRWIGKTDWELERFHGDEYSIRRGTTYNAYLVQDEKTVVIDTVWNPFDHEFVEKLEQEIDLSTIDAVISLHGEVDHSGALPKLMQKIPDTPIYCTKNGVKSLKGQYHADWNFVTVKTGDSLRIGENELTFIEANMLHWPDTMFVYMTGEQILFSSDAFGQHYASEKPYNDCVDSSELYQEAIKYYANILTPFSKLVKKKIQAMKDMNVPIKMICPSHGVIWRKDPMQIVQLYEQWANDYQENQITLLYDTMWTGTRKMAEAIADGIGQADPDITVKLINCAKYDKNDALTQVFQSKAILVGSPTMNRGILYSIAGLLEMIKGCSFREKKAAAFGCYGWSGEGVKIISEELEEAGFEIIDQGIRLLWTPDEKLLEEAVTFGSNVAKALSS